MIQERLCVSNDKDNNTMDSDDLYNNYLKHSVNKINAFYSNEYNFITPNINLIDQKFYGGYTKMYFDNKIVPRVIEYNAFYPENFYQIWEILHEYKMMLSDPQKFLFLDTGNKHDTFLGHIEAIMKYYDNNNGNEYIRIPLNKPFIDKRYSIFSSVYTNHKMYDFTTNLSATFQNKLIGYFKENKFDFLIDIINNLRLSSIGLSILKLHGNAIFHIENILNVDNDQINKIFRNFKNTFIYQPKINDRFILSCWLICIDYSPSDQLSQSNISNIKQKYQTKYISELLELYSSKNENYLDKQVAIDWALKYNMIIKDYDEKELYNTDYCDYISMSLNNSTDIIENNFSNIKKLHDYENLVNSKEQFVKNNVDLDVIDWNKLVNCANPYKNLGKIIAWKTNGEFINDLWLEFYEILEQENIINGTQQFKSFHLCETHCSHIFALNHYVNTKTQIKNFYWYAYCPNYYENFKFKYDMSELFTTNWIHHNGKSKYIVDNLKCDNRINNLDLIVCNGENGQTKSLYSQIYISLNILPKSRTMIIKFSIPVFEKIMVSIISLLAHCFEVKIVKPSISYNSEAYCICKNYTGYDSINEITRQNLKNNFENFDSNNDIGNSNTSLAPSFIKDEHHNNALIDKQIKSIKRNMMFRDIFYDDYDVQNELSIIKEKCITKWINNNKIMPIHDNKKLTHVMDQKMKYL